MPIDPKKARAALEKELKGLTPAKFNERLEGCIPRWADSHLKKQEPGQPSPTIRRGKPAAKRIIRPKQG